MSRNIITFYRAVVLILALFYWLYQFGGVAEDPFGWQFRYLTIWSLTANTVAAGLLLRYSLGYTDKDWNSFISAAMVISMVVVIQYWRLHLIDPKLVGSGEIPWHQQYYLHLLGPILLWIDAILILGTFKNIKKILIIITIFSISYPIWMECFLQIINTKPSGLITDGLPYPFLNDMRVIERVVFYTISIGLNYLLIYVGWLLSNVIFLKARKHINKI